MGVRRPRDGHHPRAVHLPRGLGLRSLAPELGRVHGTDLGRRPELHALVGDADFWNAVSHTAGFTLLFVPSSVLLGLFLAVALNRRIRFIGFYRTAIFVPFVASAAATGILSTYLFNPQFGTRQQRAPRAGPAAAGLARGPAPGDGRHRDHVAVGLGRLHDGDLPRGAAGHPGRAARGGAHRRREPLADVLADRVAAARAGDRVRDDLADDRQRSSCSTSCTRRRAAARWTRPRRSSTTCRTTRSTTSSSATARRSAYVLFAVTLVITVGVVLYSRRPEVEAF